MKNELKSTKGKKIYKSGMIILAISTENIDFSIAKSLY